MNYLYTGQYIIKVDHKFDPRSIDRQGRSGPPIWGDWEDPAFATTPEVTIAKLRAHLLVYKLSDKTGFQALNEKAYDEFKTGASPLIIPSPEFPKLMRLVYECTSAKDELRVQLTKVCVISHEKTGSNPAAREVIEEFEYVAWRVGQKIKDNSEYIYDLYLEQHPLNTANEERVKALEATVNLGGRGEIQGD